MTDACPRVLLVGRTTGQFSLYASVISALLHRGAHVELVYDQDESKRWRGGDLAAIDEFRAKRPSLITGWLQRRTVHRKFIFSIRELRSYRSYLVRTQTTPFYLRRQLKYFQMVASSKLAAQSEKPWFGWILKTFLAEVLLRLAEALTPCDRGVIAFIKARRPDVILVSPLNMRFSEEADYVKAAKRLGIPTALQVVSWDKLSTKGLVQPMPDLTLVWNDMQRRDAVDIHHIPPRRLLVAGSPSFDKWFDPPLAPLSREEFCRSVGFDPKRKILMYLGSSRNIAADEIWFIEAVKTALEGAEAEALRSCQLLVRPHPANSAHYKQLMRPDVKVWPENGALPELQRDFDDMQNSFAHADATLGINSSSMIISVLTGRPTFTVKIPKYDHTQSQAQHFKYLEDTGAMHCLDTVDDFLAAFADVLNGHDSRAEGRRAFARRFARPAGLDRSAGDVVAEAVLELAGRTERGRA